MGASGFKFHGSTIRYGFMQALRLLAEKGALNPDLPAYRHAEPMRMPVMKTSTPPTTT